MKWTRWFQGVEWNTLQCRSHQSDISDVTNPGQFDGNGAFLGDMILIRSVFNLITSSPSGRTYCHSEHFPEFSQKSVLLRGT